jgi:O-antigen/teichoic acid export membrane protein
MGGFAASGVFQFLLVVAVTRGLTTAAAGAFLEAVALFMILSNFGELGADTAMVRMVPRLRALKHGAELRPALVSAVVPVAVVGTLAAVVTFECAGPVADTFFSPAQRDAAVDYVRLFAGFLPVASLTTVLLAATRGFGSVSTYVGVQNIGLPVVRFALVAVAVGAGAGVLATGLAWAAPLALGFLIAAIACRALLLRDRHLWHTPPRGVLEVAKEVWTFAGPRALAAIFGVTITWFDVLLVGALASTRQAAIYAAISRLAVIGTYALQAMGMAVAPQFSELVTLGRKKGLEHLYQVSTWWMMALTWPLYLVMMLYGTVVAQLFGPQYSAGGTALAVLSAAGLYNLATGNATILLLMAGNSRLNMLNAAGSLAINIVLNVLLIPHWGMTGAAVAWAASIIANNTAALLQLRHRLGVLPFGPGYWVVVGASTGCFAGVGCAARVFLGNTTSALAVTCLVGTIAYLAVVVRAWNRIEMGAFVSAFRRGDGAAIPQRSARTAVRDTADTGP